MITEKYIDSLDDIKEIIFEQKKDQNSGRLRSPYLYRGMLSTKFELSTSLARNCGELSKQLEKRLLTNFTKYVSLEEPGIDESVWKAMIIGQHYGLPTRLLDWSQSALVALHFANAEGELSKFERRDCVVWRIDVRELNDRLPEKYRQKLKEERTYVFSVKNLEDTVCSLEEYDYDMGNKSLVTIEPPSIDQRIANQYSFFTVVPPAINDIVKFLDENTNNTVKYIIDKKIRWDLRDTLDQLNMNERMIYPGKEGIAKWLARHYYVKKTGGNT
ncbi:MAG: FRG domain-containing protein [Lachnospiraceae bacterium]|nr:FRG domain-containing protein [Lachnospiraceae bacterium]MBR6273591.1 FRG domain-containing protein [Lachnospiraceae bacterium]